MWNCNVCLNLKVSVYLTKNNYRAEPIKNLRQENLAGLATWLSIVDTID